MENNEHVVENKHTLGIVSLILSIVGIFAGAFAIILGPLGIFFGYKSKKIEKSAFGTAGLLISSIITIFVVFTFVTAFYIGLEGGGTVDAASNYNKILTGK